MYITDSNANLLLVGSGGSESNITINSPDNSMLITGNGQSFQLQVSETIQAAVEASIKAGDNISLLNNDSNYITLADVVTPGLQAVTDVLNTTTNAIVIETTPGTGFSYTSGGVFGAEDSTFQVGAAKLRVYGTAEISGTVTLNDGLRGAEADKKLSIRTNTLSEDSERFLADNVFGREVLSVNGIPADTDGNITITGDTGFIPITGTENSNPVTGDILLQYDGYSNRLFSNYIIIQDTDNIESSTLDNKTLLFSNSSTGKNLTIDNEFGISTGSNSIGIKTEGAVGSGLYYDANYFPNTTNRSILDKEGVQTLIDNNSIPLSGTTEDNPITGVLEAKNDLEEYFRFYDINNVLIGRINNAGNVSYTSVSSGIETEYRAGGIVHQGDNVLIETIGSTPRGISGSEDYTPNITDLDYTQKKYVDTIIGSVTSNYQLSSQKAQPNGYASLDSGGKIPQEQLPQREAREIVFVYSSSNVFTMPSDILGVPNEVYLRGQRLEKETQYTFTSPTTLTILPTLISGDRIIVSYNVPSSGVSSVSVVNTINPLNSVDPVSGKAVSDYIYTGKNIIPVINTTGFRYLSSSNAPGYTQNAITTGALYERIAVTPLTSYRIHDFTYSSTAICFFSDGNGDLIKIINLTTLDGLGNQVSPRDARYLYISVSNIATSPNFYIETVSNDLIANKKDQSYSIGNNLANGAISGFNIKITPTTGLSVLSTAVVSNMIPVVDNQTYILYISGSTSTSPHNALFYDQNGIVIGSKQNIDNTTWGASSTPFKVFYITPVLGSKFIRVDISVNSTEKALYDSTTVPFRWGFFKSENIDEIFNPSTPTEVITGDTIDEAYKRSSIIDKTITDKTVALFGDSITATSYGDVRTLYDSNSGGTIVGGKGGWDSWFINLLRPKNWLNYSVGGYTITDISGSYGQDMITLGNNSFQKRTEIFIRDYNDGLIPAPDIVFIIGGTNDFGATPERFVTESELAGMDYDLYMETTFMMPVQTTYDMNILTPLPDINRGKIAGAIRYIVERMGGVFPNTKFMVCTPIQSTAHNMISQMKVVRDIKWIAKRLSLPLINQWENAQMPMLWDYKTDSVTDNHKLLGDNVHPFNGSGVLFKGQEISGKFIVNEFLKNWFNF